jgi:PilZ domain
MSWSSENVTERRRAPRQRTLLAGTVREMNKTSTWSCTVRNISENGARLEVANASWLPNHFDIEIIARDLRQPVRVVWRDGGLLGVSFKPDETGKSRLMTDQVIDLQAERERLRKRITDLSS